MKADIQNGAKKTRSHEWAGHSELLTATDDYRPGALGRAGSWLRASCRPR
jgi:hypothetical protein